MKALAELEKECLKIGIKLIVGEDPQEGSWPSGKSQAY